MGAMMPVRGAGGSKQKSSTRTPIESPDSLRSRQYARIIDMISEGEIVGLVDGMKSIYLDDVPLQNADNSFNFDGVVVHTRNGTHEQDYIEGFSQVESEIAVGVEITASTPVVRTLTNINLNACRVTIRVPALTYQHPQTGDLTGSSVQIAIDRQTSGGGWQEVLQDTISGKTTTGYYREYRVPLVSAGPWDIRVRRLTADSTTSNLNNATWWNSYTEIVDAKLSYPHCALVGLQLDAEQFERIPTRGYHMRGQIVRVPTNYDPETRTYTGTWDGTFKPAWTDNPAWVFYDVCTNDRYALGEFIEASQIDKWGLYQIGRYCDELVPDGFGGMEPRFTIFLYKQQREEAYSVITALASVFRGITYWAMGQITAVQDRPGDPVAQFTAANVIGGEFRYQGSSARGRHTVALVTYNDPADRYRQRIEPVIDEDAVRRYGVIETEVLAFGCKSRGQAARFGRWLIYSETTETETVSFRAGLDAARIYPGAVIQTFDAFRAGKRHGGRLAAATASELTLDAPVTLEVGKTYEVAVVLPSGVLENRPVVWAGIADEIVTVLTLATALSDVPQQWSVWVLAGSDLVPETWRVLGIVEADPGVVEITALQHHAGKFAAIEEGLVLDPLPVTAIDTQPAAVTGVQAVTVLRQLNAAGVSTRITVSWIPPTGAVRYVIAWRRDADNWRTDTTNRPSYDIDDVPVGSYAISVRAINALGREGPPAEIMHTVDESAVAPDVQNLRLDPAFGGPDCPITWDALPSAHRYNVKVFDAATLLREAWVTINAYTYTYALNTADGGPRRALRFEVLAYTPIGHSANAAVLHASNPAPAVPAGVVLEVGPGQVGISATRPADTDLVGMIVWMGTEADFTPDAGNLIYQGGDNAHMKTGLSPGVTVYFRVAFYDRFGMAGINISSSVGATPLATRGITKVTALPANPSAVGGELAVFLDVADLTLRGLYGWDGTQWVFTRDGSNLVANSVTADRMAVTNLSSISANLGTMTAGNFTLDATGWIRGGAASWVTGKGIWQGYHDGNYKWRVGTPGGAGAAWDGTNFTIYGPAGEITLQSGASVGGGGYDNWADLVDDLGPITTGNVGTLIPTAAIGAAQIGSIALVGTSNFSVKTANTGGRTEMNSRVIKVFDASNTVRLRLGDLEA